MKTLSKSKILHSFFGCPVSKWAPNKKAYTKLIANKPLPFLNPIIDKPLLSKALDNEKSPEVSDYIQDQKSPLATILSDMQADRPIFTLKSIAFEDMKEGFEYLITNKENFPSQCFKYLERVYLTIIVAKAADLKPLMQNEAYKNIFLDLLSEVQTKNNSLFGITPNSREVKRSELKEILEIPEIVPIFVYILHDYISKNIKDIEIRRIIDVLRTWEDLFSLYLPSKVHAAKLKEILQWCFEKINTNIDKLMFKEKLNLCMFMRSVKYSDPTFLDYMMVYCEMNFDRLDLVDLIFVLYLGNKVQKVVPFELLYRTKKAIVSNLKKMNPKNLIRILEIYSKKKMFFVEKLIESTYNEISQEKIFSNLNSVEHVLLLYHYSNSRFRDESLFERILEKIEQIVDELKSSTYLNLVMLSLAHLNYTKQDFFMKLHKKINVIELVENVKKNEDLYEDEKEYFRTLLKKIEDNCISITENTTVDQVQVNDQIKESNIQTN